MNCLVLSFCLENSMLHKDYVSYFKNKKKTVDIDEKG